MFSLIFSCSTNHFSVIVQERGVITSNIPKASSTTPNHGTESTAYVAVARKAHIAKGSSARSNRSARKSHNLGSREPRQGRVGGGAGLRRGKASQSSPNSARAYANGDSALERYRLRYWGKHNMRSASQVQTHIHTERQYMRPEAKVSNAVKMAHKAKSRRHNQGMWGDRPRW